MKKNEFIGFRVEADLQQAITAVVQAREEFKNVTDFARKAINKFIVDQSEVTNPSRLSHPLLPELIKIVNTIKNEEQKRFLYLIIDTIKYNEISSLYNLVKRHIFDTQGVDL